MFGLVTESIHGFGLIGLLFSSFIGSTIFFPLSVEFSFPILVKTGVPKLAIILFATLGSVSGTMVNYLLGKKGIRYIEKRTDKIQVDQATNLMNKYGWAGIFLALALPIPLPVDPLTLLCGATKMNYTHFILVVLLAKTLKYALTLGVVVIVF